MDQSFEDAIKQIIKAKMNPGTEDVLKKQATVDAEYFGDPQTTYDKYGDVLDPKQRRALVDQYRQGLAAQSQTYGGIIDNRDVGIGDIVNSFSAARQAQTDAEKEGFNRYATMQQLAIQRQQAASSGSDWMDKLLAQDSMDKNNAANQTLGLLGQYYNGGGDGQVFNLPADEKSGAPARTLTREGAIDLLAQQTGLPYEKAMQVIYSRFKDVPQVPAAAATDAGGMGRGIWSGALKPAGQGIGRAAVATGRWFSN